MLDLGKETATLRIFIKFRSEISSKWSLMSKVALQMYRSKALSCISNFIPTCKHECFSFCLRLIFYLHLFFVSLSQALTLKVVKTNAHHSNIDKNNNGIKRNGISILSWRKNKISPQNETSLWMDLKENYCHLKNCINFVFYVMVVLQPLEPCFKLHFLIFYLLLIIRAIYTICIVNHFI